MLRTLLPLLVCMCLYGFSLQGQGLAPLSKTQNPDKMSYPRIEIYREIDKGNRQAGSDRWTDPNGHTVYGGKADYRPFILKKTYLLSAQQQEALLQKPLRWLPYFGTQKPNIRLGQYFEALAQKDRNALYKLLPENLNALYGFMEKHKENLFFNTLLIYAHRRPDELVVVHLSEDLYFIDNVYYGVAEEGLEEFLKEGEEELLFEARFEDFLLLSPLFQHKLTEGFPHLRVPHGEEALPLNEVVLMYALSPGMPNTRSYDIQIRGDGYLLQSGLKSNKRIAPNALTALLLQAKSVNWQSYGRQSPKAFAHDRQVFSVGVWQEGTFYRIEDPDLSDATSPLSQFVQALRQCPITE